jgi:catechol-2,3-dioxygenase
MRVTSVTIALSMSALALAAQASPQVVPGSPVSLSTQPSMNVFRRYAVDTAKMTDFYGKVLGLSPMPPINQMQRFRVGTAEIKLQSAPAASQYVPGAIRDVIGLRVFTLFFPSEAELASRFTASGLPAPGFKPRPGGGTRAFVKDPQDQWVELVALPNAPAGTYDRFELGLTVSDIERSRVYYRSFVGLEELPPVDDAELGTKKYPFRHGTMTVNLWQAAPGKTAANAPASGIQYVISDVEAVDRAAKAHDVKVDRPLGNFGAGLRTLWLFDPDGSTNYFAQIVRRADAPPSAGGGSSAAPASR